MDTSEPVLELIDVSAGYDGEQVIEKVNLQIANDDFIGIIGPNGGGKTTLLKVIIGLITPYSGKIVYHADLKNLFGYLPQNNFIDRNFPINVRETVLSGLLSEKGLNKFYTNDDYRRADALLESYGVGSYSRRHIGELSGGQLQRVLLCRAVISSPRILILDEPTTFTDADFERDFFPILQDLNKQLSIVVVSHDLETISSYAKTLVRVNRFLTYEPSKSVADV
ncbi:MAG: ATP-binding cassette domain-containing protein [Culturomica sp.]|jgi:zinc transport system ATP-binding protein|nr:ATP-binding cassette domain-containing protein [Culturomica sp.]